MPEEHARKGRINRRVKSGHAQVPGVVEIGMMVVGMALCHQSHEGFQMPRGRNNQSKRGAQGPTPLGAWVRNIRTEQGLSQRGLADRAGLSRSYLCDIERGRGEQPSMETLDKLSAALGFSRNELLRAAGMLEGGSDDRYTAEERRLLAVFRDLDEGGRTQVMRFARFVHADEHAWVQPSLHEDAVVPAVSSVRPGPTLFDMDGES